MKDPYRELLEHINTLKVIDIHEHLSSKEEDRDKDAGIL